MSDLQRDYINGTYLGDNSVAPVKSIQWSPIVSLIVNLIMDIYYSAFYISAHLHNAVVNPQNNPMR